MSKLLRCAMVLFVGVAACRATDISEPPKVPQLGACVSDPIMQPSAVVLHAGSTFRFVASGGTCTTAIPTYVWAMSDTSVATVDSTGLVRAKNPGVASVRAQLKADLSVSSAGSVQVVP